MCMYFNGKDSTAATSEKVLPKGVIIKIKISGFLVSFTNVRWGLSHMKGAETISFSALFVAKKNW
ncbi:MAG: hypothetical protein RXR08_14605 [Sulfolobaceae archaeon]